MKKLTALLVLSILIPFNLLAQSTPNIDGDKITRMLYQYVNDNSPGLAIGIVSQGDVVYEKYVGLANLENQIKIDKKTRFNIASNAKQFTALCIIKLVDQGKINLEDDIRTFLPNVFDGVNHKITIAQLLNHTSGIRDYCELMALQGTSWWKRFIDNGDVIDLLQSQKDLNFLPGTDYLYSNSNYTLLTEIVKKVTGLDFDDFAKQMFEELQMPNTHFLSNYSHIIPYKARPYNNWNGWRENPLITSVHGDGALFTTLTDQLRWEQILQLNNGSVVSKELVSQSQLPIQNSETSGYGYGLFFDNDNGLKYTYHDGATGAYQATFLRFPTKSTAIVIMSNNGTVPSNYLAWQIARQVLQLNRDQVKTSPKTYPEKPLKIEKVNNVKDVLGNYLNEDGTVIRITENKGTLYRNIYQRDPVKLIREKDGLFKYETIEGLRMHFSGVGTSNQKLTLYMASQKPAHYQKVEDENIDKTELNGRYYNAETETEIILDYSQNDTYKLTKNGRERNASLVMKDYIRMLGTYEIKIVRNNQNRVVGLKVDNTRIKNVTFVKME